MDAHIEVSPAEIRIALVDRNGCLRRLLVERLSASSVVGGIYLGRVKKVEKRMGAAFVDIGLEKPAFLSRVKGLHEGEIVIVQVIRDAWRNKSAGLMLFPKLEGRYLAFGACRDDRPSIEFERNVHNSERRARLETIIRSIIRTGESVRVKLAAETIAENQLAMEVDRLRQRWQIVNDVTVTVKPPYLLEDAPRLVKRVLLETATMSTIIIDDRIVYEKTASLAAEEMPDLDGKVAFHSDDEPLFRAQGIDEQIEEALERRVVSPSGAILTFDHTEALTAIDVDLGNAATTGGEPEEVYARTNLDVVPLIAQQILLRNLAGLIVIDFISMRDKTNRQCVVELLREVLRDSSDGAVDVLGMTASGLVEVTRQRRGSSLANYYIQNQPPISNPEALACAALRDALRTRGPGRPFLVAASEVIATLEGSLLPALEETNRRLGQPLGFRSTPGQIGFEIVLE